jgi:hypothetical protein
VGCRPESTFSAVVTDQVRCFAIYIPNYTIPLLCLFIQFIGRRGIPRPATMLREEVAFFSGGGGAVGSLLGICAIGRAAMEDRRAGLKVAGVRRRLGAATHACRVGIELPDSLSFACSGALDSGFGSDLGRMGNLCVDGVIWAMCGGWTR